MTCINDYLTAFRQLIDGSRLDGEQTLYQERKRDTRDIFGISHQLRILNLANGRLRPQYMILHIHGFRIFGVPVDEWLRVPHKGWAEGFLDTQVLRSGVYFNAEPLHKIWQDHLSHWVNASYYLYPKLMFQHGWNKKNNRYHSSRLADIVRPLIKNDTTTKLYK